MSEPTWRRLRRFWRPTVQGDVDDEFEFHFQMRVDEFVARGLSRADAERAARDRYGNVANVRSELVAIDRRSVRRQNFAERLDGVRQDVAIAIRALRREPLFALGVIVTLALGIGANATMFGIIDRLMLRGPEHVVDARLVNRLYISAEESGSGVQTRSTFGYITYATLRDRTASFARVGAYMTPYPVKLGPGANARTIPKSPATWDFFPALGVRPLIGRFFDRTEDGPQGGAHVAVISEELWVSEFGGQPRVIGTVIALDDEPYTVVGVAPRGFTGVERSRVDVWLPMTLTQPREDWTTTYRAQWLKVVVRLKPRISREHAALEATKALRAAYDGPDRGQRELVASVRPLWYGSQGTPSRVANVSRWLMGVAAVVLLITCANVANLFVARSRRRRREIAVRLALGSGRMRLFRFVLTETIVVAIAGGAAAVVVAMAGGRLMRATLLSSMVWDDRVVDARTFLFTALVTLTTGIVVGLAPALDATRTRLTSFLMTGDRAGSARHLRLRTTLSVAQAALCVVLLIGAGLFVQSLGRSRRVDLGFEPSRVIRIEPRFAGSGEATPEQARAEKVRRTQVIVSVLNDLRRLPWIERASIAVGSPYGNSFGVDLKVPGRDSLPKVGGDAPFISAVTSDYFASVGTPLRRGRVFTELDRDGSAPVVIVNETMAKALWPGEDALGKCLVIGDGSPPCSFVVGVVGDVHLYSIREPASMQYYIPFGQERGFGGLAILVRPRGDASEYVALMRRTLLSLPQMPFSQLETLQSKVDPEYKPWQLGAAMFGVFGALALIVAAVGLYSVIAYLVADRTRELGVRLALGANPGGLVRQVVAAALATTLVGIAIGTVVALAAGRFIEPLLFDVSPRDPLIFIVVAALVMAIALVAAWRPAVRAGRVDPVIALRAD